MNRTLVVIGLAAIPLVACVIKESPPANQPPAGGTATATAAPAPTPAPTPATTAAAPAPTPTTTAAAPAPTPTMPGTMPTGMPTAFPGMPAPTGTTAAPGGGLTMPGVCIPIGSWTKKFDNNIPSSGTVQIATPVIFNQFPVSDGVVVAGMPAGSLKGTGAMTSGNDLSIDVSNAGYVVSYTCKFGSDCKTGKCTVTKGSLGGFSLVKQ
jgi:hypothetical protein